MGTVYRQPGRGRRTWMLKYFRNGQPIFESSGTDDKTQAKKLLRNRETDIDRGLPVTAKVGRLRFEEAVADVVNDYKVNDRSSIDELERRITKHLQPFFGGRRMSTITSPDVRSYIAHRRATPIVTGKGDAQKSKQVSNGEINRELTALKRAFTLAVQGGKLLHRPHIPMLKESNVRTGFFEREQFEAVCAHLPAPLKAVMRFAYITGWRIDSEILTLEWRQVDFHEKLTPSQRLPGTVTLDVGAPKNEEGRIFPFTQELLIVLEAQKAEAERLRKAGQLVPWVFFRIKAKRAKPIRKFVKAWKTACLAAGAPGRIPHDLRRTAVRNLVRAGVPERVAMRLTGHKTRSVFERYNIVSDGDLGTAAERIDDASKNGATRSGTHLGRLQTDSHGHRRKEGQ